MRMISFSAGFLRTSNRRACWNLVARAVQMPWLITPLCVMYALKRAPRAEMGFRPSRTRRERSASLRPLARSFVWLQGHDSSRKVPGFIVLFQQRHRLRPKDGASASVDSSSGLHSSDLRRSAHRTMPPVPASPGRPWELTGDVYQSGTCETLGHEAVDRKQTPCSTRLFLAVLKGRMGGVTESVSRCGVEVDGSPLH